MVHVNNAVYADWLDEAVIAAGGRRASSGRSRASPGSSTSGPSSPGRGRRSRSGPTADGWSCRVAGGPVPTDGERADRLRARLEPLAAG